MLSQYSKYQIFAIKFIFVAIGLLCLTIVQAQENKKQPKKAKIYLEKADYLDIDNTIANNAERLIGNVVIHHKDITIYCDSAYMYSATNSADAFGNVRINKNDTLNLFAGIINYNGNTSYAIAKNNVRLQKKTTTLYSEKLDFDLKNNIGYYTTHGKIVDSINILESTIGEYHMNKDIAYFYKNVEAYNDKYRLDGDTLIYNTKTTVAEIFGPTIIKDSTNILYTENGWYNTNTGETELTKNSKIYNDRQQLKAGFIQYNRATDNGKAEKNVVITDKKNHTEVFGNHATYSNAIEVALITDSAQFVAYGQEDTLYMHADTLKTVPDTIADEKIIKSYYGVRFFRKDLQGVCDSMVYFTKDSVIQLHIAPVIWSKNNQLKSDYIVVYQYNDKENEAILDNNSFIISQLDSIKFNQIKGKKMIGFFDNKNLNKIKVSGNGQTLYYASDKKEIIGLNKALSSNIDIFLKEGKIAKIAFLTQPEGGLTPLDKLKEEDKHLIGFDWLDNIRPKSRFDIFRKEKIKSDKPIKNESIEKIK